MFKKIMGAVALAVAMVGSAQAAAVTLNAGDSIVFNFSNPAAPLNSAKLDLVGFVAFQGETGTITYYSGLNLAGSVIYVDNAPSSNSPADRLSDAELLDPFSILISISAGSFTIDPSVNYRDAFGNFIFGGNQSGTVGDTSGLTPTTPPSPDPTVPEPSSLALVALAGLGLVGARRRRT